VKKSDGDVVFPGSGSIRLDEQDGLTITVTPQETCFCYIITRGEDGKVRILYDSQVQAGTGVSAETPRGAVLENCYIIIGRQRQEKLEGLISNYRKNTNSTQRSLAVYNEMQYIQRAVNDMGEPVIQYGSIPGATTRGPTSLSPSDGKIRYSGLDRYVRIINIRQ